MDQNKTSSFAASSYEHCTLVCDFDLHAERDHSQLYHCMAWGRSGRKMTFVIPLDNLYYLLFSSAEFASFSMYSVTPYRQTY